jgi:hypothetical protein
VISAKPTLGMSQYATCPRLTGLVLFKIEFMVFKSRIRIGSLATNASIRSAYSQVFLCAGLPPWRNSFVT